ncbi:hypothetical protein E8E13_002473 [Curvularia kusanoi]|uniref:Uncharacterized protein n=1 Tax=Curvularia kusanoi TaxID=90978 RepID=A0A9P4TDX2_CURKU|nr:hypothetical protein E8E13_002473 [Curvularia kusanoi]
MQSIARKLTRFLSPPVASSNKRKASEVEEIGDNDSLSSWEDFSDEFFAAHKPPTSLRKRTRAAVAEEAQNAEIAREARLAAMTRRVQQDADAAVRRARLRRAQRAERDAALGVRRAMRNTGATRSVERDIQEDLEQAHSQEEDNRKGLPKQQLPTPKSLPRKKTNISQKSAPIPEAHDLPYISPVLISEERWKTMPNCQARIFYDLGNQHSLQPLYLIDTIGGLHEPSYAVRDAEIRDALRQMAEQIEAFAKRHFSFVGDSDGDEEHHIDAMAALPKETVKIIGCVASGGPSGARGWEELIREHEKRPALVSAIVGNVLVEQVLQHMFFGGFGAHVRAVSKLQYEGRDQDGFDRNASYAHAVRRFLEPTVRNDKDATSLPLPTCFNDHVANIVAALVVHLSPLQYQNPNRDPELLIPDLFAIVTHAALLSLHMRLDADTAYLFTPAFKETPFVRSEMTCFNEAEMTATHPRAAGKDLSDPEVQRRKKLGKKELERMKNKDRAIVQLTLLPGVTAYRRGEFDTTAEDIKTRPDKVQGIRVRQLTLPWVACRWGVGREIKDWKDVKVGEEVHGARWKDPGFVEFFPGVKGVPDPVYRITAEERARLIQQGRWPSDWQESDEDTDENGSDAEVQNAFNEGFGLKGPDEEESEDEPEGPSNHEYMELLVGGPEEQEYLCDEEDEAEVEGYY